MGTVKVSVTLDEETVTEAKALVGERGFSRYLNESLALRLQRERLADLEAELSDVFGPVPDDVAARVGEGEWPR